MSDDSPNINIPSFQEMFRAARDGDRETFGRLLKCYERLLRYTARHQFPADLRAKADPSDLIQETFVDAQRDFQDFRGPTEAEFVAWLQRLLLHKRSNFIRAYRGRAKRDVAREQPQAAAPSQGTGAPSSLVSGSPNPEQDAILRESAERCLQAIEKLPPDEQALVRMRLQENLPYTVIGRRLKMSDESARKLLQRILESVGEPPPD